MAPTKRWIEAADDHFFAASIGPQTGSEASIAAPLGPVELHESQWPGPDEGWPDDVAAKPRYPGTFFDEAIDLRDPEGHEFTLAVLSEIGKVEDRRNRRSAAEEGRHYILVRKLLANGLRCAYHRMPSRVAFFVKAEKYRKYPWLNGPALSRSTALLEAAGLVARTRGFGGKIYASGCASTYDGTDKLLHMADACGVGHTALTMRLPEERLVRLKKDGKEIDFEPTDQTEEWAVRLAAWNDFISEQQIDLSVSEEEEELWTRSLNNYRERSGMPYRRPELFQRDLYRSFVDDFDRHGRLYGGWWISAPGTLRARITINGEPTAELDFSSCSMGMLYNHIGLPAPSDAYELEKVSAYETEAGLVPGHFRDTLKVVGNTLLNCGPNSRPARVIRRHQLPIPPVLSPEDVVALLEEKHQPIAPFLRANMGLRIHRWDSDLALEIISRLADKGIVALPVHDSFISPKSKEGILRLTMEQCYEERFGAVPSIGST